MLSLKLSCGLKLSIRTLTPAVVHFCLVFVFCFVNLRWTALAYLWWGQLGLNPWALLRISEFSHLSKQQYIWNTHVYTNWNKKLAAEVPNVQTPEVLFQCCFLVFVWHIACKELQSQERRWREEIMLCTCLLAQAYQSSATLIRLNCLGCKSLVDLNWRLRSLLLQAKTPLESPCLPPEM